MPELDGRGHRHQRWPGQPRSLVGQHLVGGAGGEQHRHRAPLCARHQRDRSVGRDPGERRRVLTGHPEGELPTVAVADEVDTVRVDLLSVEHRGDHVVHEGRVVRP